jgi:hypothetical protein
VTTEGMFGPADRLVTEQRGELDPEGFQQRGWQHRHGNPCRAMAA